MCTGGGRGLRGSACCGSIVHPGQQNGAPIVVVHLPPRGSSCVDACPPVVSTHHSDWSIGCSAVPTLGFHYIGYYGNAFRTGVVKSKLSPLVFVICQVLGESPKSLNSGSNLKVRHAALSKFTRAFIGETHTHGKSSCSQWWPARKNPRPSRKGPLFTRERRCTPKLTDNARLSSLSIHPLTPFLGAWR